MIVLAAVILSWLPQVNRRHPLAILVVRLTEPVLEPIRKVIPLVGGLDLSPMVLLFALQLLKRLL